MNALWSIPPVLRGSRRLCRACGSAWWSVKLLGWLFLLSRLIFPPAASAQCGALDPGACMDSMLYTTYTGVASGLWLVDRMLLIAAYYTYAVRWWLMDVAFTTVADILTTVIDPLLIPFATLALLLALLLVLLMPVTGRTSLIKVRPVLLWTIAAPLLLVISGPLMLEIDTARMAGSSTLFQQVVDQAGSRFAMTSSAQVDKMTPPVPIYGPHGGEGCATSYFTTENPAYLRSDELVAALFWADARDIHCPTHDQVLPRRWYDGEAGPGYAFDGDIGAQNPQVRGSALIAIQHGINRLIIGSIPALLALMDALIQLAFSLALVLFWIALLVALPFVFFQEQANPLVSLLRHVIGLFKASWTGSVVLAIMFAGLKSLADSGHALALVGFSLGTMVAAIVVLVTALGAVKSGIAAIAETVQSGSGLNARLATDMVSGGAGLLAGTAIGAATGGAGLALTAAMGYRQSGSLRYAGAAAAGRIRPVMQVGTVAAAMGWLDAETESGLWAGSRPHTTGIYRQMRADAHRRTRFTQQPVNRPTRPAARTVREDQKGLTDVT